MGITRRQLLRAALALSATALGGCAVRSGGDGIQETSRTLFCFDTVCVLGGVMSQAVLDQACGLCERYEELFSRTKPTSDVGRINAAGGKPVEVATETVDLVGRALRYCEESGGLFDITIGAVSELWDFVEGVVPSAQDVARALPHVDHTRVEVGERSVTLHDPDARIDLGGIAKGYIADRLIESFASSGVQSAYVNLGGNVKVLGAKADGTPWRLGVRDPGSDDPEQVVAKVSTEGGSLVTSGLYERSFERDGTRYWHILDPRTGYPVETHVVSASVFSQESIDGDGLTKPLFMLPTDEALALLGKHTGLQGLIMHEGGGIVTTPGATFELV